jgi:hypothetical protein
MCQKICSSQDELQALQASLKTTPCPHCKKVGYLIRHGFLRGYDETQASEKSIRATRVFCSNRNRANGCGKTFSVWIAQKVKRLFLSAESLVAFLQDSVNTGNKRQAFRKLNTGRSDSVSYRIWKRFLFAQSHIRTALMRLCSPPHVPSNEPTQLTLIHLQEAFKQQSLCSIAAFQVALQTFFI